MMAPPRPIGRPPGGGADCGRDDQFGCCKSSQVSSPRRFFGRTPPSGWPRRESLDGCDSLVGSAARAALLYAHDISARRWDGEGGYAAGPGPGTRADRGHCASTHCSPDLDPSVRLFELKDIQQRLENHLGGRAADGPVDRYRSTAGRFHSDELHSTPPARSPKQHRAPTGSFGARARHDETIDSRPRWRESGAQTNQTAGIAIPRPTRVIRNQASVHGAKGRAPGPAGDLSPKGGSAMRTGI